MKIIKVFLVLALSLLLTLPASADVCYWGYSDAITNMQRHSGGSISYNSWLYQQQTFYGIPSNVGMVSFAPDYTILRDAFSSVVSTFQSGNNAKMFIDMTQLLFETVPFGQTVDCRRYGASANEPSTESQPKFRIHPSYLKRLANFADAKGHLVTGANTAGIVVFAEANNSCVPQADLVNATSAVRLEFPGIPTVIAYAMTHVAAAQAKGLPPLFPWNVDRIGFWSYGVFDPADPSDPKNANLTTFYDPANPNSTATQWGRLKARLRGPGTGNGGVAQKVLHVPEAFWTAQQAGYGWVQADLGTAATNWFDWAAAEPLLEGHVAFKWVTLNGGFLGTQSLPTSVKGAHAGIAGAVSLCP